MTCKPQWISAASFISGLPLFEGLKPGELADIVSGTRKIIAARGDMLFRKNDACTGLFLIVFGQVKLFFSSALGNEKVLDVVRQNQTIGDSTLFQGKSYETYAQALNECTLLHIAKPAILDTLDKNPVFARRVIDHLSQSVSGLTEEVESYSLCSGRQRVVNYLLREARRTLRGVDRSRKTPLVITLQTSKGVIASCLNLTQEHFSRILRDLSADGLLSVFGRDIHIENPAAFWQYAGETWVPSDNSQQKVPTSLAAPRLPSRHDTLRQKAETGLSFVA
jgi:CRP-like cAMP-binding protein